MRDVSCVSAYPFPCLQPEEILNEKEEGGCHSMGSLPGKCHLNERVLFFCNIHRGYVLCFLLPIDNMCYSLPLTLFQNIII